MAYLMLGEGLSLRQAIGTVYVARPFVLPNRGFVRQLNLSAEQKSHVAKEQNS